MSAVKVLESEYSDTHTNNISVNARADYILRFSKQAVIVLGEAQDDYCPVARQFIANLTTDQNAAFITVSEKFNDIQIRCRLIEQLFPDILFDPELSLAVSLLNLIKQKPQKIAIAFEHIQHLSLQLIHELVQLADIAKKMDLSVNVILCGDQSTGYKIADNTILFKNKVSILSALSGQIIPLTSSQLKKNRHSIQFSWVKALAVTVFAILIGAGFVTWHYLSEPSLSEIPTISVASIPTATFVTPKKITAKTKPISNQIANNADILQALQNAPININKPEPKQPASAQDVLNALTDHKAESSAASIVIDTSPITEAASEGLYPGYSNETAFVIQFAAFATQAVKQKFISEQPILEYLSYPRLINQQKFEVLTSTAFLTYEEAKTAIAALPASLKSLKPWVKSVKQIKTEIKHYQSSQL